MMDLIMLSGSFLLGVLLTFYFIRYKVNKRAKVRQGIYVQTSTVGGDPNEKLTWTSDFIVVKTLNDKVKLKSTELNIKSAKPDYHSKFYKEQLRNIVDNWHEENDSSIIWEKRNKREIREDKLKELLNNKFNIFK